MTRWPAVFGRAEYRRFSYRLDAWRFAAMSHSGVAKRFAVRGMGLSMILPWECKRKFGSIEVVTVVRSYTPFLNTGSLYVRFYKEVGYERRLGDIVASICNMYEADWSLFWTTLPPFEVLAIDSTPLQTENIGGRIRTSRCVCPASAILCFLVAKTWRHSCRRLSSEAIAMSVVQRGGLRKSAVDYCPCRSLLSLCNIRQSSPMKKPEPWSLASCISVILRSRRHGFLLFSHYGKVCYQFSSSHLFFRFEMSFSRYRRDCELPFTISGYVISLTWIHSTMRLCICM